MLLYLQQLIQLILSPGRGWEDVASHPIAGRVALSRGLLLLAAVAGVSELFQAVYAVHPDFSRLIPAMVVGFLQYFLTYYLALAVMMSAMPRLTADGRADEARISVFLSFSVGMLCLIGIIENLLPMPMTLFEFLPIYVAVVMFKGRDYLDVRSDVTGAFVGLTVLCVIVPLFLIGYLLSKFI